MQASSKAGRTALWLLVMTTYACAAYNALRSVIDVDGVLWHEFFDNEQKSFYYFNPTTGRTQWTVEFAEMPEDGATWRAQLSSLTELTLEHCDASDAPAQCYADAGMGEAMTSKVVDVSVLNKLFPVDHRRPAKWTEGKHLPMFHPPMQDDLVRRFLDPAGAIRFEGFEIGIDELPGIQARRTFGAQLKPPIAFSYLFVRLGGVEAERSKVEHQLMTNNTEFELWEMLGHIWRQYGDVHRAIDCYRKAISLGSVSRSSLYLSLAGILDQMNFVHDALSVLDVLLDGQDPSTIEAEINFPWAYFMSSQLHLRQKHYAAAGLMLDEALYTQASFSDMSEPLNRDLHYQKLSCGSSPMFLGAQGKNNAFKDPWLTFRFWLAIIDSIGEPGRAFTAWLDNIAEHHPQICLLLRKLLNASFCVMGGYASHRAPEIAEALRQRGLVVTPVWFWLTVWLMVLCFVTMATDFMPLQVIPLMFLGHVWGIPVRGPVEQGDGESEQGSSDEEDSASAQFKSPRR